MAVERITTVLVAATATAPASPYDLTDLTTVKDELALPTNDTSNDNFLQRAITQASISIANYCNRVFPVEGIQDLLYLQQDPYPWQVPGGVRSLQLSRWPLVNAQSVSFTGNLNGTTSVTGLSSTTGIVQGSLIFASDGSIPAGTTVSSVDTVAGSLVMSNAATATETGASLFTGVQVVQTLASGETQTLVYGQDFTTDSGKGWLIRLNDWTDVDEKWEAVPTTVIYQGGYSTIPYDLVDACLRLVTARFRAKGRDPMLVERTQGSMVGTERYWVGNAPGQRGAFSPEIAAILDNYRVPVVA